MTVTDLAVVGAGPAGLSAALVAGEHGLNVTVVDEQQEAGGQIFRRPAETLPSRPAWGRALLQSCMTSKQITWRHGTTAWGVFDHAAEHGSDAPSDHSHAADLTLAVHGPDGPGKIRARALLVATGAYDLPVAFPGWTLPGVYTAGGAQTLVKAQHLLPASRFVLAGAHPLLVLVADQLLRSGAKVEAVALAGPLPSLREGRGAFGAMRGHWGPARELAAALFRLKRARVPIHTSTIVSAALGDESVEAAVLARVDDNWRRIADSERSVVCDGLVIGYGFLPMTELARQAGCAVSWDSPAGGWVVCHDEWMRTDRPGVYVAGEPTGVAGAEQSAAEGRLAGLAVVHDLERVNPAALSRELTEAIAELRSCRHFSTLLQRLAAPKRDALAALCDDDTVICRCEEVTAGNVRALLRSLPQMSSANAVKLACRTGMGACQGRFCQHTVAQLTADAGGRAVEEVGLFTARPPVKPVPLSAIAAVDETAS